MRRAAAAALAVPVLVLVYLRAVLQRSFVARIGLSIAIGAAIGIGVIGTAGPAPTTATPPSRHVPLTSVAFRTDLRVGLEPTVPIVIAFSTPMDETSVAAHLEIVPATPVVLAWNEDATSLTVRPATRWALGTLHTITVGPGALAASGRPLSAPARAAFLTRAATAATISATAMAGKSATPASGFLVTFDGPIDVASVRDALVIEPAVAGTFERLGRRTGNRWLFTPGSPLAPGTTYTVALGVGARDAAGAPLADGARFTVRTAAAPEVVRFRPRAGTKDVARDAGVSVRFSETMDRAATKAAFSVSVDGKPVAGKVTFQEHDAVLVFDPAADFDYSKTITMTVAAGARSAAGVAVEASATGTFTTVAKPAPKPKPVPKPAPKPAPKPIATGSAGSGSWFAVEKYYLGLMNCTRTGGWVTSTGSCSSPGGRNVAPLALSSGISDKVSRPYAKLLATRGLCDHFIGGNPGDRLRRAGFTSYIWAENLGCRSGNPYSAVLGSHLFFQSEKSYNGGHYVNLMNAKYDRAGIGVWVYAGRVRLVVDFYHPR